MIKPVLKIDKIQENEIFHKNANVWKLDYSFPSLIMIKVY